MDFKFANKVSNYIWINGEFIKWEDAYVHVLTHSLHYAGAVFEGERAYCGKVFKLMEHTMRLLKSADHMSLKVSYSAAEINKATNELLKINNLQNAYIRPLIWRGAESISIYTKSLQCNLLILAQESNPVFKNKLKLCVTPWRKVSADAMPPQCKSSAHYAMNIVSRKFVADMGYDDGLVLDQYGDIAECITTNIFFGKDNELVTPIADRFLNGITRQTVIEIARNLGIKVREARLTLDDIASYDTCFITGTSAEVTGVEYINVDNVKMHFPNQAIILKLQQHYAQTVGKSI
ncbi:MAG: aminotransferase class IV [Rickettsiaceae bacterium]